MAYEAYVTPDVYGQFHPDSEIPQKELPTRLRQASRHIDSLTFNRILGEGFASLTPFQQEIIQEVVCLQTQFEFENEDEISTVLSSYSINGVSVQFGSSWNVFTDMGVAMRRDVYALLSQTGLCCRLAR